MSIRTHIGITRLGVLLRGNSATPTVSIPLDSLSQALITVFKESFWRAREELKKTNAQFDPQQLDATDVRLDHAYLRDADLVQAWLQRASLREADLGRAQLNGADLREAQLERAILFHVQLNRADLSRAQLNGAILRVAQLNRANLFHAQLQGVDLRGAQLNGAYLFHAQLEKAYLFHAQLERAYLFHAQLQGADLRRAQLQGANLRVAQLQGADLTGANPEDAASLKDTKMNGVTGFTPEQREACIKKGAIIDAVQQAPASDTRSSSSLPSVQSNDVQTLSAPTVQESTQIPGVDGSNPPPPSQSSS